MPSLLPDLTMASFVDTVTAGYTVTSELSYADSREHNPTNTVDGCKVMNRNLTFLPWDNPDNFISVETQLKVSKGLAVVVTLVSALGMALNALNCAAFARLGLGDRINFLLFSLACADLVSCVYFLLSSLDNTTTLLQGDLRGHGSFGKAFVNSGGNVVHGAAYVSRLISTLIACERLLCITAPFTARRLLTTGTAALIVGLAAVLLLGLHSLVALKFQIGCHYIPAIRAAVKIYHPSDFYYSNARLVDTVNVVLFAFFLPFFFVITTTLATALTVFQLRRAVSWRSRSSTTPVLEAKEVLLTKMLVAVSCQFIVCSLPNILSRTIHLYVPGLRLGGKHQNTHMITVSLLFLFNAINSSVNFFFYYKMGSSFREVLRGMFARSVPGNSRRESRSIVTGATSVTAGRA